MSFLPFHICNSSWFLSSHKISLAVERLDTLHGYRVRHLQVPVDFIAYQASSLSRLAGITLSTQITSTSHSTSRGDCLSCLGQILSRQMRFEEAEEKFTTPCIVLLMQFANALIDIQCCNFSAALGAFNFQTQLVLKIIRQAVSFRELRAIFPSNF